MVFNSFGQGQTIGFAGELNSSIISPKLCFHALSSLEMDVA